VSSHSWFANNIEGSRKIRIAIKYCGSCNPEIDLSTLGGEVRRFIAGQNQHYLVSYDAPDIDVLVVLCGCQRTCADREEITSSAKHSIIIAGEGMKGTRVPEKDLAATLTLELELLSSGFGD
jgi:hypothetical protein